MAEPVAKETTDTYLSFSSEFDSIAIPPLSDDNFCNSSSGQALLGNTISDLRFFIDGDFELTLEDSVVDLYFPSENESFLIPVDATNREMSGDFKPASEFSGDCGNKDAETDTNGVLISTSSCYNQESPRDSDCSGTVQSLGLSTQESANCVSDILKATNASTSPGSVNMVFHQKLKLEEEAITSSITKRKKEIEQVTIHELRNYKYRRLDQDGFASVVTEDDEKRNVRLIKNRESAHLSRQRKKHYVEELEDKVKNMHSTITDLTSKMSYFMAENVTLRQQVGSGSGMYRPLHQRPVMYPVPYQWMPCPAYMVKPQGSQVALLPIPRLKPQQSVAKVKKFNKVASFSVLGLLFCLILYGELAPIVNISYGEYKFTDRVYDQSRGRVLDVNSHLDVSDHRNRTRFGKDSDQKVGRNVSATENSVPPLNSSEPLVASLFVPRNQKLVKIDGNLIIHSVLASEEAMTSETTNGEGKIGVATTTNGISPALPLPDSTSTKDMFKHLYSEKRKALSSSGSDDASKEELQSTAANGKMQRWFHEGGAGPMFSSGMCTKVCQFDVSTTSGAIIPASPPIQQSENTTDTHKGKKNRRILRGGLRVSDFNLTKDHNSSSNENFQDTKPSSSMVVSVLVDPREGSDGDIDGMMGGTKSLSQVFIVLLVDGVKYVTYSCVLPQPEVPHLVTT